MVYLSQVNCSAYFHWTIFRESIYGGHTKPIGTVSALLSPITIILNSVTLIALLKCRGLQRGSLITFSNLLVNAFLAGIVALPLYTAFFLFQESIDSCLISRAFEFVGNTLLCSTFLTLCLATAERYVAIFHPFKYMRLLTKKNLIIFTAMIWILSVAHSALLFISPRVKQILELVNTTFSVIGAAWMILVYIRVLNLVRNIRRRVGDSERRFCINIVQRRIRQNKKHAWFTVLIILAFNIFCVTHPVISVYLDRFSESSTISTRARFKLILAWGWLFFFVQSALTPIVIWISCSEVRSCVERLVHGLLSDTERSSRETRLTHKIASGMVSKYLQTRKTSDMNMNTVSAATQIQAEPVPGAKYLQGLKE